MPAALDTVSAGLPPPEGGRRRQRGHPIDRHIPGLQRVGDAMGAPQIGGPHVSGQTELRAVGELDVLYLVVERDDAEHRPEDLVVRQRAGRVDVGENRWLDVTSALQAGAVGASAAVSQSPVAAPRSVGDYRQDALA